MQLTPCRKDRKGKQLVSALGQAGESDESVLVLASKEGGDGDSDVAAGE